jgi:molybdate transport system regulatory protein
MPLRSVGASSTQEVETERPVEKPVPKPPTKPPKKPRAVKVAVPRRTKSIKHLQVRSRISFYQTDPEHEGSFCRGIALLLQGVNEYGSLSLASKRLGMAYSNAWKRVKNCEEIFGFDLIVRNGARGSTLTREGEKLLATYQQISAEINEYVEKRFRDLAT